MTEYFNLFTSRSVVERATTWPTRTDIHVDNTSIHYLVVYIFNIHTCIIKVLSNWYYYEKYPLIQMTNTENILKYVPVNIRYGESASLFWWLYKDVNVLLERRLNFQNNKQIYRGIFHSYPLGHLTFQWYFPLEIRI